MNYLLEIAVIIVFLGFIGNGARAGAVESLGRLAGSIIGYLVAKSYVGWLAGILGLFFPTSWAFLGSFLLIFLVIDHLVGIAFELVGRFLKIITWLPVIKQIDGLIGGILGFLEGVIVIGGISWLLTKSGSSANVAFFLNLKTVMYANHMFGAIFAKIV